MVTGPSTNTTVPANLEKDLGSDPMLRAARARRISAATAFGGGGLTLVGGGTVGLLYLQARLARSAIGFPHWERPRIDGLPGEGTGLAIRLLMAGDSTAAGFAVDEAAQTPGVMIARGISAAAERPVRLRGTAVTGATSARLAPQLDSARVDEEGTSFEHEELIIADNELI